MKDAGNTPSPVIKQRLQLNTNLRPKSASRKPAKVEGGKVEKKPPTPKQKKPPVKTYKKEEEKKNEKQQPHEEKKKGEDIVEKKEAAVDTDVVSTPPIVDTTPQIPTEPAATPQPVVAEPEQQQDVGSTSPDQQTITPG